MSGHANYGSSETLQGAGAGVRQWKKLVMVDGVDSATWGITCSISNPATFGLSVQFRITWGNGGVQHQVILTAQNGFTISVDGDSVQVEASLNANVGQSVDAAASASDIDTGRPSPVFAQGVGGVAVGATATVNLPEFTKAVRVIPVNVTLAGYAFTVADAFWQENFAPNEKMDWTPVTGSQILITNNDPVDVVNYAVFCELSI